MEKHPLTFTCSGCNNPFTNLIDTSGDPTVYLRCPFCYAESVADLSPYPKHATLEVLLNDRPRRPPPTSPGWPDVIPTTPKPDPEADKTTD